MHVWRHWREARTQQAFHYGMSNFSASLLNNVFITYYVEMFLTVAPLQNQWFMMGQVLYCGWNCVNDPIFGWIGDTQFAAKLHRRLPRIRVGGPLWALAFLLPWFPWTPTAAQHPVLAGLHFFVSMLLYDGMLSWTMVAHQALLADMTTEDYQRERCTMFGAACHLGGAFSVFLAHQLWDPSHLLPFQTLCVGLSLVACGGFYITTHSPYVNENAALRCDLADPAHHIPTPSLTTFITTLSRHSNFRVFVVVGLLQQFSCTFNTNFFSMFLTAFTGNAMPHWVQSSILLSAFVVPHLCTLLITPLLHRVGKYMVVQGLIAVRLACAVGVLCWVCVYFSVPVSSLLYAENPPDIPAPPFVSVLTAFLLVNRVVTECVCRLVPLIITDLIDEDTVLNSRKVTMSSMYFGCHAFFTKPGQSLAPMFGWWVLHHMNTPTLQTLHSGTMGKSWLVLVQLVVLTPILMTCLMLLGWRKYSLKGHYLKRIKATLARAEHDLV
eukprot:NODE_1254_length_1582_cov_32.850172_g1184_i0.p1 GENE.NODE_1254_length_1582_cov_32.850172_g1184_i0~~NODE_1254_length_1582_cov_32.850172_g1184_i0.p1  ORF type:complete len:495 (+),score=136.71 NODE_1254_length_1582_cov_32.850172_g1184_i0:72-1556(+)